MDEQVKVKLLKTHTDAGVTHLAGAVISVPDHTVNYLIEHEIAEKYVAPREQVSSKSR